MDISLDMQTPVLSDPKMTEKVEQLVNQITDHFAESDDRVDVALMAMAAAVVMSPGMRAIDEFPALLDMVNAAFDANGADVRIIPKVTARDGNRRRRMPDRVPL